jgi:glycosyltransferase involved in cell wall biosynthesis
MPAPAANPTSATGPSAPPAGRRILVYTDDPDRGGVAHYNHALLLGLVAQGFQAHCIQPRSRGPLVQRQQQAGVIHHWLPYDTVGPLFARTLSDMATPKALFEAVAPDLIVFSDCCPVSNLAARHAALALRLPFIVVIGFVAEYLVNDARDFLGIIAQHYAQAREVIAVSEHNLGLLRSHFGLAAGRGRVVHYGRPAAFFAPPDPVRRQQRRAALGLAPEAVVAITMARLEPIKGYMHQLAAIRGLDPGAPNRFLWVGEGGQRVALEREIKRQRLQRQITLVGHQWDTPAWYDLADLYILPSEHEGMPLSIMEAMAKSLPVIASAVSGIPEEVATAGKLIPDPRTRPSDAVREMADTIKLWTAEPNLRRQVGAAGRERAERMFHEESMVEKTLQVIRLNSTRRIPAAAAPVPAGSPR